MERYGQYCPLSRAADLLDGRWTLVILRDLMTGSTRFTELLRGNPGLSRALLSRRLDQLIGAGILERDDAGRYRLTRAGEDLRPVLFGLADWGSRWAFGEPEDHELDPELLMWWLHRRVDPTAFDVKRFVVHVRFRDHVNQYWIVVEDEPSLCDVDPRFPVDVEVLTDLRCLYRVHLGRQELDDALARREVDARGAAAAVRSFRAALPLSPVAGYVRAATVAAAP